MSSDNEGSMKKKKGKGLIVKLVAGAGLMVLGGGGAFAFFQSGLIASDHKGKETNEPKLLLKGEEDPYAPKSADAKEGEGQLEVAGEGGSKYRTSYFNFSEEFTSNLKNSDTLVQIGLTASTRRDGRVLMWMKKHEMAIRSQILAILADTPEEDVFTMEGKDRLQKRMTAAINNVLIESEGFGGVDAVYFKTFLVQ